MASDYFVPTTEQIDDSTIIANAKEDIEVNPTLTLTSLTSGQASVGTLTASSTINGNDILLTGYLSQKTPNRVFQQNLTATTTTSLTAVTLGSNNLITPNYSGHLLIGATVRCSNNTLADGVTISLLNGSTVLDTETYTQEGLASNEHTITLYAELTGQTVGTQLTFSLNFNAVTGGTASAKIVSFIVEEL